jgi:hypothetical protein
MATLPGGGPAEDGSELRSHACGVAKVEARGHAPGVGRMVYLVDPSATLVSHVQRGAHQHLVCMRDERCAVSARSCRHQVLLCLHASSGHPGQHAPRRDPQSSGGGSEAARRRPGGRGAAASVSRESSLGQLEGGK